VINFIYFVFQLENVYLQFHENKIFEIFKNYLRIYLQKLGGLYLRINSSVQVDSRIKISHIKNKCNTKHGEWQKTGNGDRSLRNENISWKTRGETTPIVDNKSWNNPHSRQLFLEQPHTVDNENFENFLVFFPLKTRFFAGSASPRRFFR